MLSLAPLFWAGNALVGRMVYPLISPMTLNFMRWVLAGLLLLPLARWVVLPNSVLWAHWRRYALLGLLGVGCYNSFQYLALRTSSPINVTLVASSTPVFMLGIGALFFGQRLRQRQLLGAALSVLGVLLVLCRGDITALLQVELVWGDVYVLVATACWAGYSWLISVTKEPAAVRGDWAAFLLAQIAFGLFWSGSFTATEWVSGQAHIDWGLPLLAALAYVAVFPALLAYRCWGLGVQAAGPNIAGFFVNLTPLFAALLSALALGEWPQWYHMAAFALIVGGIAVSSRSAQR
ncbi:MAG: DMT family transporter [Betaproteobacteria bacterium]|nr:DMT family transporter [Betaproteobacteria bacterium]